MSLRDSRKWLIGLIFCLGLPALVMAEGAWNTNSDNLVLDGYDVVAYHQQDRAVRGRARFSTTYEGAGFRFDSQENLTAFQANPEAFVPKFGGYCAFGVAAKKARVPANPETFKIYNGELLLFFNDLYEGQKVNTKVMWNQNERSLYEQAVAGWKTL